MNQPSESSNSGTFLPDKSALKKLDKRSELTTVGFPFAKPFVSNEPWSPDDQQRPKREGKHMPFGLHFAHNPDDENSPVLNLDGAHYDPATQMCIMDMTHNLAGTGSRIMTSYITRQELTSQMTSYDSTWTYDMIWDAIRDRQVDGTDTD